MCEINSKDLGTNNKIYTICKKNHKYKIRNQFYIFKC